MQTTVHPFEQAGLGVAPFFVTAFDRRTFQAAPDAPVQPGTCCDYCGTGICNVYIVTDVNGKAFKVGSDCVEKVDFELYTEAKRLYRAYKYEIKSATWKAERDAKLATYHAEIEQRKATFSKLYGGLLAEMVQYSTNSFLATLIDRFNQNGTLSDRQIFYANNAIAAERAKATVTYVGKVGDKVRLTVMVEKSIGFDTPFGRSYIELLRDADGNRIVYKGKAVFTTTEGNFIERGEWFILTATVKEHALYNEEKQTIIQRPKVVESSLRVRNSIPSNYQNSLLGK